MSIFALHSSLMATAAPTTLFIFPLVYPYDNKEAYLAQEIRELSKQYERVVLFPMSRGETDVVRTIPANAEVNHLICDFPKRTNKALFLRHFWLIVGILFGELKHNKQRGFILKKLPELLTKINVMLQVGNKLIDTHLNSDKALYSTNFYAPWMHESTLMLSLLKKRGKIPGFVFRVHGFDLWEERWERGYLPFRAFNISQTYRVATISKMGGDYLKKRTSQPAKIITRYLGIDDFGIGSFNPEEAVFRMVSVANLIPLKRLDRVLETLRTIDFRVHYIIYGDGPEMPRLKQLCNELPAHIQLELRGAIDNADLMEFYSKTSIHAHILVSETEGLPISVLEAISFGIPGIVTNVGGVPEFLTDHNGVLLPKDFTNAQLADAMQRVRQEMSTPEFRVGVRETFKENFLAERNYEAFYREVLMPSGAW